LLRLNVFQLITYILLAPLDLKDPRMALGMIVTMTHESLMNVAGAGLECLDARSNEQVETGLS
jgi:hypothetical protein